MRIDWKYFVVFLTAIAAVVAIVWVISQQNLEKYKIDAQINQQTEVERTKIEEEAATQRTRERMHWLPWYDDEENK